MYCCLVSSGLVFNVIGPFKSKATAEKWLVDNSIKTAVVVALMPSGAEEDS